MHGLLAILVFITSPVAAPPGAWIDSMEAAYSSAALSYDSASLLRIVTIINQKTAKDRPEPRALLLTGQAYWRLALVAYCTDNPPLIEKYGKKAKSALKQAEKAGADLYLTSSFSALSSLLLAGLGVTKGAMYGPRAAAELKEARRARPDGYFSLLIEAITANQAPSFAGGNPEKAVTLLLEMTKRFPDSVDVKIHLADAYRRTGQTGKTDTIIAPIVDADPGNLLARKVAGRVEKK